MDTLERIRIANLERLFSSIERRLLKLSEEQGEAAEAYLSASSKFNYKNKSYADVREELVDVMIVAADILWLEYPDEGDITAEEKRAEIDALFAKKLKKWVDKKAEGQESMTQE